MDPCKLNEPNVIDKYLIKQCSDKEIPEGEEGRLYRLEEPSFEETQEIKLEFLNILRIDHLWMLKSLKKLSLNNNYIEKIEHLDELTNLIELDLSFNRIRKLENISTLVKLEKFNVYSNVIEKLECIENLCNLVILSVGSNQINDIADFVSLRNLHKLKSLNVEGNPCTHQFENVRCFGIALLPQLHYWNYSNIETEERHTANELFGLKVRSLLEEKSFKDHDFKDDSLQHAKTITFVEYLNTRQLYEMLFENDPDSLILINLDDDDDGAELQQHFDMEFNELCLECYQIGQQQFTIRHEEREQYNYSVQKAQKSTQNESISLVESYLEEKVFVFQKLEENYKKFSEDKISFELYNDAIDECEMVYTNLLQKLWKDLMRSEMDLNEQIEEMNQIFEQSINEIVNGFVENIQTIFTQIRSVEQLYTENVTEFLFTFTQQITNFQTLKVSEYLREIMVEKETLQAFLTAAHDQRTQIIDNREDTISTQVKNWVTELAKNIDRNELKRNRTKVLEISNFLDIQRQEYDELILTFEIDPDRFYQ